MNKETYVGKINLNGQQIIKAPIGTKSGKDAMPNKKGKDLREGK